MGSLLALWASIQLPAALEAVIPDADERASVVDDVVAASNPQGVPSVIGPSGDAGSTDDEVVSRDDVVAATEAVFSEGIKVAEGAGFVLALGTLVLGWIVFPPARPRD
jgi:hypothetical protein